MPLADRKQPARPMNYNNSLACDIKIKSEPCQTCQETPTTGPSSPENYQPRSIRTIASNIENLREAVYVRYLFEDFVLSQSKNTQSGWLALLLPKLYASAGHGTTLSLAVRAAAYAYMANKLQRPELQTEARKAHICCLRALGSDLARVEIAASSSTLTAVLVLGVYECIAGNGNNSFWHSHGQGLQTLMSLRCSQTCKDLSVPVEEMPDGIILCQMQRRNLDLRKPPSPEEASYVKDLDRSKPANEMFSAAFECSNIVARAYDECLRAYSRPASAVGLASALLDIRTFDANLQRLFQSCISQNGTAALSPHYPSDSQIHLQWLSICPTYRAMAMWIFLKGARIILRQVQLQCLEKLQTSGTEAVEALNVIKESTEAIFSAIAYMTEPSADVSGCRGPKNIGGYYLLWPLHVIVDCGYTTGAQRYAARDALLSIGSAMGLNHAFEIARAVM